MRTLAVLASALLLAGGLFAQRGGYGSGTGFGNVIYPGTGRPPVNPNSTGFGSVVFPGAGATPRTLPFSITDPNFARGLGNTVSGRVPYGAGQRGHTRGRGGRPVYVPYAYPVYVGGYDAYNQQQEQPNVTVIYPQPQPPVVVNQNFVPSQQPVQEVAPAPEDTISVYQGPMRSSEDVAAAASQAAQPYYLIAFKDHSIYSAVAYWIDGETLHYFTSGNTHNQVSMALVDKELTERLNKERHVDIRIK